MIASVDTPRNDVYFWSGNSIITCASGKNLILPNAHRSNVKIFLRRKRTSNQFSLCSQFSKTEMILVRAIPEKGRV